MNRRYEMNSAESQIEMKGPRSKFSIIASYIGKIPLFAK